MKKRVMLVGAHGSGKSTVANWLNDSNRPLKKSQDAIYGPYTIDIPAAYLENHWMYRYIFSLAQTAGIVMLLVDGGEDTNLFPPNFANTFACPVVGMIKSEATDKEIKMAERMLKEAGVGPPYYVFEPNSDVLNQQKKEWLSQLVEGGHHVISNRK